jgi:hypothetical protein
MAIDTQDKRRSVIQIPGLTIMPVPNAVSLSNSDRAQADWLYSGIVYVITILTTGNELRIRIQNVLRADKVLQTLLGKISPPYGIYWGRPPLVSPPFPLVTLNFLEVSLDDADSEAQTRTTVLQVKVYYSSSGDTILERIEQILNNANWFSSMYTMWVHSVSLDYIGPDDLDVDFNCYTSLHTYKIFTTEKLNITSYASLTPSLSIGTGYATGEEFKTSVQTKLRADTTLRSLLNKAATPFGIYFAHPPLVSPPFPLVTFKIIGGSVNDAARDAQTRSLILQVVAYSSTNCDDIMKRIDSIMTTSYDFTGTSFDVLHINLESIGSDDFDIEFNTYTLTHRYRVFLSKIA